MTESLQYSRVARHVENSNEVIWRAVDFKSKSDHQPFQIKANAMEVSKIRDFADGTYSVSFVLRDMTLFKTLLSIEQKAKDKLALLAQAEDAYVKSIVGDHDEPSDIFLSKISQIDVSTLEWTIVDQIGPRDAAIEKGKRVGLSATLIGVMTCRGRRGFHMKYEINAITPNEAESIDDEYDDDDGPDPEVIADIREELIQNASKLVQVLGSEYQERIELVENIKSKVHVAKLDELETLATELDIASSERRP